MILISLTFYFAASNESPATNEDQAALVIEPKSDLDEDENAENEDEKLEPEITADDRSLMLSAYGGRDVEEGEADDGEEDEEIVKKPLIKSLVRPAAPSMPIFPGTCYTVSVTHFSCVFNPKAMENPESSVNS